MMSAYSKMAEPRALAVCRLNAECDLTKVAFPLLRHILSVDKEQSRPKQT